jgi:hypothetical protein
MNSLISPMSWAVTPTGCAENGHTTHDHGGTMIRRTYEFKPKRGRRLDDGSLSALTSLGAAVNSSTWG